MLKTLYFKDVILVLWLYHFMINWELSKINKHSYKMKVNVRKFTPLFIFHHSGVCVLSYVLQHIYCETRPRASVGGYECLHKIHAFEAYCC